jgi:N-succinyldiaminopimelate aminotransferase
LCAGLVAAGFLVHVPAATYFVMADTGPLGYLDGAELCRELPHKCGVVAVPAAAFYSDPQAPTPFVRFAFCKRPEVLDEAAARLARLRV